MRYVGLLRPGRAWIAGNDVSGQDRNILTEHLHAMRRRYDEGSVLFGGPFAARDGGIVLLEAPSQDEAKAVMDSDPAVAAGLMDYSLTEVRTFFDVISGQAWTPK